MKEEVERHRDTDIKESLGYTLNCRGCGKEIVLHYNGGEGDMDWCCGYEYHTENVRIDVVVHREESE